MYIYSSHFCLIWKSIGTSFNRAIEELKLNIKVLNNVISDEHVQSFVKHEYIPKKVQSSLTNMIIYDLETYNKDRAVPYCSCKYKLSKISGKYLRDITETESRKCLNDGVLFKGSDCINEMLDYVLEFYMVLNNLPQWRSGVNLIKNTAGIVSPEIFNG